MSHAGHGIDGKPTQTAQVIADMRGAVSGTPGFGHGAALSWLTFPCIP
jgi:hypothetical protein